ncbi:MAG: hypothetical protein QXQ57_06275 [Sulfolobales archaeon]
MRRLIFVEDTYGVRFHRELIEKIRQRGVISFSSPEVRRLPAGKCNRKIYDKIIGAILGSRDWKVLVVIDSEGRDIEDARHKDFLVHVRNHRDRFRVWVVEPRHEAWLCLGLGGSSTICRSRPEDYIERDLNRF